MEKLRRLKFKRCNRKGSSFNKTPTYLYICGMALGVNAMTFIDNNKSYIYIWQEIIFKHHKFLGKKHVQTISNYYWVSCCWGIHRLADRDNSTVKYHRNVAVDFIP